MPRSKRPKRRAAAGKAVPHRRRRSPRTVPKKATRQRKPWLVGGL